MSSLTLTTPAALPPVTVEETADQLRLTATAEKARLEALLPVAVEQLEAELDRAFINQTWTLKLDTFPRSSQGITLPKAPLFAVTSITYKDENGATQTMSASDYVVTKSTNPTGGSGTITLAYDKSWPDTYDEVDTVSIAYVVGYGATRNSVPAALRLACQLRAGELYDNAENPLLDALLAPYRSWGVA